MSVAPYTVEPSPPAGSPEWRELRRSGIGGSEAAAVCGLSKYRSALDIYLIKVGVDEDAEANRAMRKGNAIEPFLKSEYELETGYRGYKPEVMFRSAKYPWMIANVDWLGAEGIDRGADFKSSDFLSLWGESGTEDVSEDYWVQSQHYMCVTGLPWWDIYPLLPRNETRLYPIAADPEAQESIAAKLGHFWNEHVLKRVPPPFEPGLLTDPIKAVRRLYGAVNDKVVTLSPTVTLLCEQYEKADADAKAGKKESDRLKAQLLSMVGDAGKGVIPGEWEITRKMSSRKGHWVNPSESIRTTIKRMEA